MGGVKKGNKYEFKFDAVFAPQTSQPAVFSEISQLVQVKYCTSWLLLYTTVSMVKVVNLKFKHRSLLASNLGLLDLSELRLRNVCVCVYCCTECPGWLQRMYFRIRPDRLWQDLYNGGPQQPDTGDWGHDTAGCSTGVHDCRWAGGEGLEGTNFNSGLWQLVLILIGCRYSINWYRQVKTLSGVLTSM